MSVGPKQRSPSLAPTEPDTPDVTQVATDLKCFDDNLSIPEDGTPMVIPTSRLGLGDSLRHRPSETSLLIEYFEAYKAGSPKFVRVLVTPNPSKSRTGGGSDDRPSKTTPSHHFYNKPTHIPNHVDKSPIRSSKGKGVDLLTTEDLPHNFEIRNETRRKKRTEQWLTSIDVAEHSHLDPLATSENIGDKNDSMSLQSSHTHEAHHHLSESTTPHLLSSKPKISPNRHADNTYEVTCEVSGNRRKLRRPSGEKSEYSHRNRSRSSISTLEESMHGGSSNDKETRRLVDLTADSSCDILSASNLHQHNLRYQAQESRRRSIRLDETEKPKKGNMVSRHKEMSSTPRTGTKHDSEPIHSYTHKVPRKYPRSASVKKKPKRADPSHVSSSLDVPNILPATKPTDTTTTLRHNSHVTNLSAAAVKEAISQPQTFNPGDAGIRRKPVPRRVAMPVDPITMADPIKRAQKRLGDFFPVLNGNEKTYNDSEINEISALLQPLNLAWSKTPRIYIVLRAIGCLQNMSEFIDLGFSDYMFPVTPKCLPTTLAPKDRSNFVEAQTRILTKSIDLEKGEGGKHCFFSRDEPLPLSRIQILGQGGFGQVDKVYSTISYKVYARKRVRKRAAFGQGHEAQKAFIQEIEILKRLRKHDHVVEFMGSYTDHKYIAVLLTPVAEMDLSTYLERADTNKYNELRTYFGCLSRALQFLHDQGIRHKDIKPGNILVDHGRVLYTDFGLALDFAEASHSTTYGLTNGMTPRYCAPEVAEQGPRRTSSDVYSLGIVFLEMVVVLKGKTVGYIRQYLEDNGSREWIVRKNLVAFKSLVAELSKIGSKADNRVFGWIKKMLRDKQQWRPTAATLTSYIVQPSSDGDTGCGYCGVCCISPDESSSDTSSVEIDEGYGD